MFFFQRVFFCVFFFLGGGARLKEVSCISILDVVWFKPRCHNALTRQSAVKCWRLKDIGRHSARCLTSNLWGDNLPVHRVSCVNPSANTDLYPENVENIQSVSDSWAVGRLMACDFHFLESCFMISIFMACLKLRCDCLGTLRGYKWSWWLAVPWSLKRKKCINISQLQPLQASTRKKQSTRWYTSDHWTLLELDMHHLNTSHIKVVGRLPCCQNVTNGNNSTISMEFCWRKKTFRGLNKPRNWDQLCQTIQWYKWVCLRMYSLKRVCAFWIDI